MHIIQERLACFFSFILVKVLTLIVVYVIVSVEVNRNRKDQTMTNTEAKANNYGHRSFSSAWSIFDMTGRKGVGDVWRIMNEDYMLVEDGDFYSFEKVTTKNEVSNG